MVYVESNNIPAKNFDSFYTITVTDQNGNEVYNGQYSAFSYAYATLMTSSNQDLCNLIKSMVLYNQAAKAYFG